MLKSNRVICNICRKLIMDKEIYYVPKKELSGGIKNIHFCSYECAKIWETQKKIEKEN